MFAIAAFFFGYFGVGQNVERLVVVGGQLAASEGPPPPELLATFQRLQAEIKRHSIILIILPVVAISMMATARYW